MEEEDFMMMRMMMESMMNAEDEIRPARHAAELSLIHRRTVRRTVARASAVAK